MNGARSIAIFRCELVTEVLQYLYVNFPSYCQCCDVLVPLHLLSDAREIELVRALE